MNGMVKTILVSAAVYVVMGLIFPDGINFGSKSNS